ncbi:MAG: hypothetical protein R3Y38_05820 [Rikenellaceae bacterium]
MTDLFQQWRTAVALSSDTSTALQIPSLGSQSQVSESGASPSYEQVVSMIDHSLSSLKVYVLESEITSSQNSVKSIVKQATF